MPFNRLAIYVSSHAQLQTASIDLLYSFFLKGAPFGGYHSINLYFTSLASEDSQTLRQGRFIDFYSLFDFSAFNQLEAVQARKQYLLQALQNAVLRLARQEGWATTRFEQAYHACLACELRIEWHFRRKLFLSPNRAYYFSLFQRVDFGRFEIQEVLYDKRKQEIFRRICLVDTYPLSHIVWAAWANETQFVYRFAGCKRLFTAEVADLLQRKDYQTSRAQKDLFNLQNTAVL
jgi:hypothetical protein